MQRQVPLAIARAPSDPPPSGVRSAPEETDEERAAGELVLAAREGRPLPGAALSVLMPRITATVRGTVRSAITQFGVTADPEDIRQKTLLRMLRNPPTEGGPSKLATVTAWVRVTSLRLLVDEIRKWRRTPLKPWPRQRESGAELEFESSDPNAERQLATDELFERARKALETHYRRGLGLFDLMRDAPGLSSKECTELLATSPNNVDQIRCRIRRCLELHVPEAMGLCGAPNAPPKELEPEATP